MRFRGFFNRLEWIFRCHETNRRVPGASRRSVAFAASGADLLPLTSPAIQFRPITTNAANRFISTAHPNPNPISFNQIEGGAKGARSESKTVWMEPVPWKGRLL